MTKGKLLAALVLSICTTLTSSCLLSTNVHAATPSVDRLYGQDRYSTNLSIIKKGWTESSYAIIASGEAFPDALCATPLAKVKNAPIFLTSKNGLSSDALKSLKDLEVKSAYIIGGTGVVSPNIEEQLKTLNVTTTRLSGKDRYETSVKIAEMLGTENGIAVASSENFPDALSMAPIAAKMQMPILLSSKSKLPDKVSAFIKDKNIPASYIIGGTGSISESVQTSLPNAKRLSGLNRFDTNISILKEFQGKIDFTNLYVASGKNFPDALSGSALAASKDAPIVLVDSDLPSITRSYLRLHSTKNLNIIGGTGAITDSLKNTLTNTVKYLIITKADDISDTAFIGEDYTFPYNVLVMYDDSSTKLVPVKWEENSLDTSTAGTHIIYGTIDGWDKKVKLTTKVVEETGSLYGNLVNGGKFAYYKGNIYFTAYFDNDKLYKLSYNGTGLIKISDDKVDQINIVHDWIYYRNLSDGDKLYKMKLDGSEKTLVLSEDINSFVVVGDDIYYSYGKWSNFKSGFYKCKVDGSSKVKLGDERVWKMLAEDGYLYYTDSLTNYSLHKMKLNETNKVTIINNGDPIDVFDVENGWIYYAGNGENRGVHKISVDGLNHTKLEDTFTSNINVYDGWVYYANDMDSLKLYRARTDGSGIKNVMSTNRAGAITVMGDWIFYETFGENSNSLYQIKLDGTVDVPFLSYYINDKEANDSLFFAQPYPAKEDINLSPLISGVVQNDDIDLYKINNTKTQNLNVFLYSPDKKAAGALSLLDSTGKEIIRTNFYPTGIISSSAGLSAEVPAGTYYIKISSPASPSLKSYKYEAVSWFGEW
ncbi:putative cell wall-binding protein [Clostridium pascui]|uniref:cell wall-binding repeat-containing protein n=1 Tax=Clostridium pascui TaxID=46609 RepID=UPI00195B45B2|nr:putative cell wall-binding protein [Clostridium pascui]